MTNEISKTEKNEISAIQNGAWGADTVIASDLVIPKVLLMQGLSKLMNNENVSARLGEIRGSLEGNLLGGPKEAMEIIPFFVKENWNLFEEENGKYEFRGREPRTMANDSLPLEEVVEGKKIRRDKTIDVYVLSPKEIEQGEFLPYLISFTRTSFRAGKKLVTIGQKLKMFKKPLASKIFKLISTKVENDKGTFYAFDVEQGVDAKPEHTAAAYNWYLEISKNMVRIDEGDMEEQITIDPSKDRF